MINLIYIIILPKLSPHKIQRMIPYYLYLFNFQQKQIFKFYLKIKELNVKNSLAPQQYVILIYCTV